jgi:hypothetical protein
VPETISVMPFLHDVCALQKCRLLPQYKGSMINEADGHYEKA